MADAIYVCVCSPTASTATEGLPPTSMQTHRVELLDGELVEEAVARVGSSAPVGSELIAFHERDALRFRFAPRVEPFGA